MNWRKKVYINPVERSLLLEGTELSTRLNDKQESKRFDIPCLYFLYSDQNPSSSRVKSAKKSWNNSLQHAKLHRIGNLGLLKLPGSPCFSWFYQSTSSELRSIWQLSPFSHSSSIFIHHNPSCSIFWSFFRLPNFSCLSISLSNYWLLPIILSNKSIKGKN